MRASLVYANSSPVSHALTLDTVPLNTMAEMVSDVKIEMEMNRVNSKTVEEVSGESGKSFKVELSSIL